MRRRKAWLLGGVLLLAFVGVGVYQVATPPDMPPLHVGMTYEQVFALPWGSASYLLPVDSGDPGERYNVCTTKPDWRGSFWVVTVYFDPEGRVSGWERRRESQSWLVWLDDKFFKPSAR
jgi:hypothetical protein